MKKRSIGCLFLMMMLIWVGINILSVQSNAACDHNDATFNEGIPASIDENGNEVDGREEYWYCEKCGKYARDEAFTDILKENDTYIPFVNEKIEPLSLVGEELSLGDLVAEPSKCVKVYTEQKVPGYITFNEINENTADDKKDTIIKTSNNTKYYKNSLKPFTFIVVTGNGIKTNEHKITVKFELPEPDVTVKTKWSGDRCTYKFTYNIKGATKIKVRLWNKKINKEIKNKDANKILDKYMSKKAKSNSDSYIWFSRAYLNKNKYLSFKFTAYYGKRAVSTIVEP